MKAFKYIGIIVVAALLGLGVPTASKVAAQPGISMSFQVFFNSLSPFGRWSNHPQYGSIWIPAVDRNFHPYYTDGRWVMTEYGNTWVSDYDWGWAPFHYGRWFYDDYMGWAWVPDYTWGPGWVNWRTGGGYYGWAPLMPGLDVRFSVNLPVNFWIFVPHNRFMSNRWHHYRVPRGRVTNIYNQTTIINNYYTYQNREYAYGPRSSEIQRYTKNTVPVYEYSNRGNNGRYKESVSRSSNVRTAVDARERSFDNGRAGVATGSARRAESVAPESRGRSGARTSEGTATPRSENPVATPNGRGNARETPTYRGRDSYEGTRSSRQAAEVEPGRSSSERINNSRSREAVPNSGRSEAGESPQRSARERSTPAYSRPSGPERESRTASPTSRERTSSPSQRSANPGRSENRGNSEGRGGGGRSASPERGGR